MRPLVALALVAACAGPPQKQDETAITYRAAFTGDAVATTVVFPWISDGTAFEVQQGLAVTDGGSYSLVELDQGLGLAVQGVGEAAVSFTGARAKGLEGGKGIPQSSLSLQVPDGGAGERYLKVNKAGTAMVRVDFEYTASRDCGAGCGGRRSFSFEGPVGLALQEVSLQFSEATQ